ncbi:MAG: UDP-N-acetylmuramoyl-L-alanine--D-glutamate ligase [Oscillospiraceae bacterium]|nr:UDP-N-acetylmuramoyl-L-alanine--D-glutamate ligase [Oscillospiraceae bacterium]
MTLEQYLTNLKDKRVLVLGVGVSNRPLVRLLLSHGVDVTACDKMPREKLDAEVLDLERQGAKLKTGEGYLDDLSGDVVFRTPGLRPDAPALKKLREQGAAVTSEMEAFFDVCPCPIIAVTGSDGKTTTTTLIAEMLQHAGKRVWLGGNIGQPLLEFAGQIAPQDMAVVELSSFQLSSMQKSANVAVVTNLAPNHLDWHTGMAEYVEAKKNVFCHQTAADKLVVNADNDYTLAFAGEANGRVELFSRKNAPKSGCFFDGETVFYNGQPVLKRGDIRIPGLHNVENYMAAICATADFVSPADWLAVAREFAGVEHRIELVRELRGVRIYNDSIASSPSRTTAGLLSFDQKVILIAGGYDKHIPFDDLGREICRHVKLLVLCGATADMIERAVKAAPEYEAGKPEIVTFTDFRKAVETAVAKAQSGDVVTLSPACAAFDQFKNFMERGKTFKKIVMELE